MECPWAAQMPLEPTGGGQAPAASRDSDSVPLPASLHSAALAHDDGSVPSRHPARFAGFVPAQEGSPRIKGRDCGTAGRSLERQTAQDSPGALREQTKSKRTPSQHNSTVRVEQHMLTIPSWTAKMHTDRGETN